ncbi:MAG: hypothetical protein P8X89_09315 [Reinekea sp.]
MLPKNFNEPMGAPTIFEKQIEIKLLHPASTLESRIQVTKSLRRSIYSNRRSLLELCKIHRIKTLYLAAHRLFIL